MSSCVGTILSFLFNETVLKHLAYVFQYEDPVHRLEQENRRVGEKKKRIQQLVDTATRNGRSIETEVSSWLGEVEQMERDIANFLRQQENREQMERDFANFLRQQENGEQMEREFVNILRQQENGERMELDTANFLRQQENGEQMEQSFANFLRQQENGESFKCFPGCMCPNLLWRYKRGKDADERKSEVTKLITRGELLQTSPVARSASFQSEPLFDSSQYYTAFPSRASVFEEIMKALKDSGVDMIGVHGPGGTGKTTMVKEVAKEAKELGIFDKIVIVVVSKDPNTSKLQEDLAPQLDLNYGQTGELARADELRKALLNGKRKILVILDDLWEVLDLKAIGIPISGLGAKGCKIMLTSREGEVLKGMNVGCSVFFIDYLKEQEAWELFRKVTGDFGVDECTAREVCKTCADLPIAIVAVGVALKGEEEFVWRNALSQLTKSPLKYFEGVPLVGYTPLKWSYDFLNDEDAKSCFLLCCLFPEDAEIFIDDLVKYSFALGFLGREGDTLKDARDKVQAMVNKLKRSCLLLNGEDENYVKMHDVIRDLAISITEEKQTEHGGAHDWPGQQQFMVNHDIRVLPNNDAWKHHTAISLRINDNSTFPCGVLDCPLLHTFVLQPGKSSHIIPNNFFQGTKEATVLDLENISLELPSSILELHHLRMLCLRNCKLLGDLTTIQDLKNHIEILSFEETNIIEFPVIKTNITELPEILGFEEANIIELPQEIGKLTRLRSLDLRMSELRVIPKGVISNLIYLEELYVLGRFSGWDTTVNGGGMSNASIAELKSLTQLTVLQIIISAESFKIMIQECPNLFEKLINFAIFINLPSMASIVGIQTLNVLDIGDIHRTDDEFHLLMDKVFHLLMDKVRVLTLRRIPHLEGLFLHGKPQLKFIPSGGGPFSKLTSLEIYGCHGMKFLFSSSIATELQQLQKLEVSYCSKMEQIIGVVDHHHEENVVIDEAIIFNRLVDLRLWGLSQFKSFYPKMEKTKTEKNLSNFTAAAKYIFDEKVLFPILTYLEIIELSVEYIWNKQSIQSPERSNKVSFSQLKEFSLSNCDNLVNVFPSNMLPRLQNLEMLAVEDCPSLTLLVEDLNPNIQSPTIKSKFNDVFPKLIDLQLYYLPKLMKTWLSDEDYYSYDNSANSHLKRISIIGCGSLRQVFSTFVARHLVRIQYLCIIGCPRMEVIVSKVRGEGKIDDRTIKFNELEELFLEDLPNLRSFYESNSEAPHLFNYQDACPNVKIMCLKDLKSTREIQLWDLDSTQEHLHRVRLIGCQVSTKVLSHHLRRSFRIINHLHLHNCQGFKHIINLDSTISVCEELFVDVERLKLNDVPELVSMWNKNLHEIEGLRNLKYINIGNCPQMKSLLTHSMATTLQHLKKLVVECCEMMEEIIIIEENNINTAKEEKVTWRIKFLKLEYLILIGLPNLKNFCNDERGSFSFLSLRGVSVKNCPKMKTFVSGQIFLLPRMMQAVVGDEKVDITNLNAYFEARNEDSNHMRKIIHWGGSVDRNELQKKEGYYDGDEIWNHIYRGYESKSESESE